MTIKASRNDIIWNYIGVIMTMASNFILLPFMMYFLDSQSLGLWYVYLGIGGIVILFDFGFNPTLARNIAYCWSGVETLKVKGVEFTSYTGPNYELLRQVIETCKKIYLIIALCALFILITFGSVYIYYVSSSIFNKSIIISWIIYSLAIFLNLYYGYYATFLRGVGAICEYNKINVLSRVIQIVVSIILMVLGYGIIAVSFAYFLYGCALRILSKKVFYNYRKIGIHIQNIVKTSNKDIKSLFIIIWHNAWRDGVVAVANYLSNQATIVIASLFLSLTDTGIYSISIQLITAIATIAATLYSTFQPSMQSAYINHDYKKMEQMMGISMTIYIIFFIIGVVGLLGIGIPILKLIKPSMTFNYAVIIGISIYHFFYRLQSYYASFISNTNDIPYMKAYVITGFFSIILSVLLMKFTAWGIWGLIVGQFIPQSFYNFWKWPMLVFSMLDSSVKRMFLIGKEYIVNYYKKY